MSPACNPTCARTVGREAYACTMETVYEPSVAPGGSDGGCRRDDGARIVEMLRAAAFEYDMADDV